MYLGKNRVIPVEKTAYKNQLTYWIKKAMSNRFKDLP